MVTDHTIDWHNRNWRYRVDLMRMGDRVCGWVDRGVGLSSPWWDSQTHPSTAGDRLLGQRASLKTLS